MSKLVRGALALLLGTALLGAAFLRPATTEAAAETCFAETGFCIKGVFLEYWQEHGGLALNGYPLTAQRVETLEDGNTYTVQYFERVRLEYHPENATKARVLLGQFGRRIHPADPPIAPSGDGTYYEETGHNIGGAFLTYWKGHGGLAQFGYPLTELISEQLEDGKTYQVQYFERARFELHPENPAPYDVLLGQFGRRILAETSQANLAPCTAEHLAVQTSGDAGAGSRFATIALTNTGSAACTLLGTPQVELLSESGSPLAAVTTYSSEAPAEIIALHPGLRAEFGVRWSNWCGADPGAAQMRVNLPQTRSHFTTSGIGTPPCLGTGQESSFGVNPFTVEGVTAHTNVVLRFYNAVNEKHYTAAYALLGTALQAQQSYESFAAGYVDTANVAVTITSVAGASGPETSRVGVKLVATNQGGGTTTFTGTYDVGAENGTLKITAASIVPGE